MQRSDKAIRIKIRCQSDGAISLKYCVLFR